MVGGLAGAFTSPTNERGEGSAPWRGARQGGFVRAPLKPGDRFASLMPNRIALIAHYLTSGSTGPAKGVTHTVGSLGWMFASAIKSFKLHPDDVALPASSCSHIGGFTFALSALSAGASVAVARAFDHDELGPLFRQTRPTLMSMLPNTLMHLIREHDMTPDELSSLDFAAPPATRSQPSLRRNTWR